MGERTSINHVDVSFLQNMTTWIFLPASVDIYFSNDDQQVFDKAAGFLNAVPMEQKESVVKHFGRDFSSINARYVKIVAKNPGPCPEWHPGAGGPSWMFVDEVVIN